MQKLKVVSNGFILLKVIMGYYKGYFDTICQKASFSSRLIYWEEDFKGCSRSLFSIKAEV